MRNAFIETLDKTTCYNHKIIVLSGDLGYTVFEKYRTKYPKQFINLGVGEANMMGMAAGMAREGLIPVVYSIIPFITMRCYEQIRNDVCAHDANVKIIGVGSGLGYAHLGISHHAAEDIAIMRVLPHMTVYVPADAYEVKAVLKIALKQKGPTYIRLGKAGEPAVHTRQVTLGPNFSGFILKKGTDVLIFTTGTVTYNTLQAAEIVEKHGINVQVVSCSRIKPLNTRGVQDLARKFTHIYTVEEHSIIGGLGSAIAEALLETGIRPHFFKRLGIKDVFCHTIGNYEYLRDKMGLSSIKIAHEILKTYADTSSN